MSGEWLSTVVAAVAAMVGFVLAWYLGRHSGRAAAMAATDAAVAVAAPESLYEVDELVCAVEFDADGGGVYRREERGLRPKFDAAELIIPYRFNVTPQGRLDVPKVTSTSGVPVEFRPLISEPTRITGSIVLTGPFRRGETIGGYVLEHAFEKGFLTSKQEVLQAYAGSSMPREYIGIAAYVPVRTLRVKVTFPASHRVLSEGPIACAFVGETESVHLPETAKLASALTASAGSAVLTIERPRAGLRYAVAWLPPA